MDIRGPLQELMQCLAMLAESPPSTSNDLLANRIGFLHVCAHVHDLTIRNRDPTSISSLPSKLSMEIGRELLE